MKINGKWGTCNWELYAWGHLAIEGGIATSISSADEVPWAEYRENITTVSVDEPVTFVPGAAIDYLFAGCVNLKRGNLNKLNTEGVVSMNSVFEGCELLKDIDMASFNTAKTVTMRSMFMNCDSIEHLDLSGFDVSEVLDMSWMFCGCERLKRLSLEAWNTSNVLNTGHMFQYCGRLDSLTPEVIDMKNVEIADEMFDGTVAEQAYREIVRKAEAERAKAAELAEQERQKAAQPKKSSFFSFFSRNSEPVSEPAPVVEDEPAQEVFEDAIAEEAYGEVTPQVPEVFGDEPEEMIDFTALAEPEVDEDEEIEEVAEEEESEMDKEETAVIEHNAGTSLVRTSGELSHSVYAGAPYFMGLVEQIPPITYGERLSLRPPQVNRNGGDAVSLSVEISPDGVEQWTPFNPNLVLPASGNGCYVRYKASNSYGFDVTEPIRIIIRKADFDISEVRWKDIELTTYDGKTKSVHLVGIPEGLRAIYDGNSAVDAGEYIASARWEYDARNYNCPPAVEDFVWRITKADYHMPNVRWNYEGAFEYDGTQKFVALEGLIPRITPVYRNNVATDSGVYYATVELDYDHLNYNAPAPVMPCKWEISKTDVDMSDVRWKEREFTYDGSAKTVELEGVPEGVKVRYVGNSAVDCGIYTATAFFDVDDANNYRQPGSMSVQWSISRAVIKPSELKWSYDEGISYDGTLKTVKLENVPKEVNVRYYGNSATEAGTYEARAEFAVVDEVNYVIKGEDSISLKWHIDKADYDMSAVCWDYNKPFVYSGIGRRIELLNLPRGVRAEYSGNSAMNAGSYVAEADFVYDDVNYNKPKVEPCKWEILKADVDVSGVYWASMTDSVYDGSEKSVALVGLPEILRAEYKGNRSVKPGEFVATAELILTEPENYNLPQIRDCKWYVEKANFSMDRIAWDYSGAFTYDGRVKRVSLINVPEGFSVEYTDNERTNAGTYTATARLIHDEDCYVIPDCPKCTWTVEKADYDLSNVCWNYKNSLVYDGTLKEVVLENLPEGIITTYIGNSASEVGRYAAKVVLDVKDPENYNVPSFGGTSWSIEKAAYDLSEVRWVAPEGLAYNGETKTIVIEGLPSSIHAEYSGNQAVKVGDYVASVKLNYDEHNYYRPVIEDYPWSIEKGNYDFSNLSWNYSKPFTYDGNVKSVELTGYSYDVSVRYSMNRAVDAGIYEATAYFTLEDTVNYKQPEPMKLTWMIDKASFDMDNVRWSYDDVFTYDGSAHTVKLYNLPEGVWADYEQNVAADAGQYEAKATFGVNNHQNYVIPESRTLQWEIRPAEFDMSGAHWDYRNNIVYDGNEQGVELLGLPKGVKPIYTGNRALGAGKYEASAVFKLEDDWNFVTPKIDSIEWNIDKAEFDMSEVHWSYVEPFVYDGSAKRVQLVNLPEGVEASYFGNVATGAGTYEARVKLTAKDGDNFNSPVISSCKWRILKADHDMSRVCWDYREGSFTYDGTPKSIELLNLPAGVSATYTGNSEVKAGNYVAEACFSVDDAKNFNVPYVEKCRWNIARDTYDMSGVSWNYSEAKTYDGREKSIELINLPDGVSASYSGNAAVAAGDYNASAKLLVDTENYETPTVADCRWTILKADPNVSSISWNYADSFVYDGLQKSVALTGIPQGMTVSYAGNQAKSAGTYTAEAFITMDDSANYNTPVIEPIEWRIDKADYDMSRIAWNVADSYVYDGRAKTISLTGLPEGLTPMYKDHSATNAGTYSASVSFKYDRKNYNAPSADGCEWTIGKADYDMSAVCWNYHDAYTYDGMMKSVELIGLPQGVKAVYENNAQANAGTYIATVCFEYDEQNYNRPSFGSCTWTINKADVDLSKIRWNYNAPFTYNGGEHSVALMNIEKRGGLIGLLMNNGSDDEPRIYGLPDGMDVSYDGNTAVDAGVYTATVFVTPQDINNYNVPDPISCKWEIKKAEPDMSELVWDYENVFSYDGKEKRVSVSGLPEGVSIASYEGNTAVDVGTYIARVSFRVPIDGNYSQPEERTLRWRIEKATIDMSDVRWDYTAPFAYDGNAKTVSLINLPAEVSATYINNSNSQPGTYVTKAVLSYDKSCYRVSEVGDLRWRIED
ncbi:MAG: BspA family leucine-rich repeat surface protein [Firmicutes bacterium]|nr:BspA family leucine-rich repeat surface protein [Bacillota bacterium]